MLVTGALVKDSSLSLSSEQDKTVPESSVSAKTAANKTARFKAKYFVARCFVLSWAKTVSKKAVAIATPVA